MCYFYNFSDVTYCSNDSDCFLNKSDFVLRVEDVEIRHIQIEEKGVKKDYLARIITKSSRKSRIHRNDSVDSYSEMNGIQKLCSDIEIRESLLHPNVLRLYAVRDSEYAIYLCIIIILFIYYLVEEWKDYHSSMRIKSEDGNLVCSIPERKEV